MSVIYGSAYYLRQRSLNISEVGLLKYFTGTLGEIEGFNFVNLYKIICVKKSADFTASYRNKGISPFVYHQMTGYLPTHIIFIDDSFNAPNSFIMDFYEQLQKQPDFPTQFMTTILAGNQLDQTIITEYSVVDTSLEAAELLSMENGNGVSLLDDGTENEE